MCVTFAHSGIQVVSVVVVFLHWDHPIILNHADIAGFNVLSSTCRHVRNDDDGKLSRKTTV